MRMGREFPERDGLYWTVETRDVVGASCWSLRTIERAGVIPDGMAVAE